MNRSVPTIKRELIRVLEWSVSVTGAQWGDNSTERKRDIVTPAWVLDGHLALSVAKDRLAVQIAETHYGMGVPIETLMVVSRGTDVVKRMDEMWSQVTADISEGLYNTLKSNDYMNYIGDIEAEDKVRRG